LEVVLNMSRIKNVVIKLCMMGMNLEDSGNLEDATTEKLLTE
jgi:hypothetical protein